mmetsp:Transcript_7388/g.16285  ORF Transcript_7388/g.16285 Transcript_7388/m.16285 type:complete len:448 (-) Transcript_7388:580-1923(-)
MSQANWGFKQVFGDRDSTEEPADEDLISAVEFDSTGEYLATGDRGGRVVIFEASKKPAQARCGNTSKSSNDDLEYRFYCEFQSHEPEFDYLKSLEIEEKINCIRWCKNRAGPIFLLSTNDKTIKLWKIFEKRVRMVSARSVEAVKGSNGGANLYMDHLMLRMPTLHPVQNVASATLKRCYSNGHTYHINSLSFNNDGMTFLSADDLRVNIWNMHSNSSTFNIVDIKPDDMEDLSEVITRAEFHPTQDSQLVYSSSKGLIRLCDLRESARCERRAGKLFGHAPNADADKSFFSEVVSSISDVKFSPDGRYIMARDYMTLKIWDVNMDSQPLRTIKVHEHLRSKLSELYDNDFIFDKFECSWGGDNKHVCSGTYDNKLQVWDTFGEGSTQVECTTTTPNRKSSLKGKLSLTRRDSSVARNFNKKVLFHAHHPETNLVAIGARNSLYIFG